MIISRHFLYFIFLGLFWGLSQSLYKAMALQNMPISHVIVYAGFGVGLGLVVVARLAGTKLDCSREVIIFGLGCAILLNVPFAIGLYLIRHLPATEMALIVSTAPFFNYVIALATGRENAVPRRLLAVAAGFVSSAVLILSREGMLSGQISWWTLAGSWRFHSCSISQLPGGQPRRSFWPIGQFSWRASCGSSSASPSSPSFGIRVRFTPFRPSMFQRPQPCFLPYSSMAAVPISGFGYPCRF